MLNQSKTRFIVYTGVLSALAIILYFIAFPVIPGSNYLKIDAGDLPAVVAGIIMGPLAAIAVEFIKVLIHVVIRGFGSTMGFGDLINFIVGVALTVPFSGVWRTMSKRGFGKYISVLAAGVAGLICMVLAGVIGNYLIAPLYFEFFLHFKLTGAALWAAIGSATILNLIKSVLLAVVMFPIIALLSRKIVKV